MTVTPIGAAGLRPGVTARRPAPRRRRGPAPHATVHFEVVVAGPDALPDVLDGLADIARRLGDVADVSAVSTRVTTYPGTGSPGLAPVPEPAPAPPAVQLFPKARHVTVEGRPVALSYTEFNLLMHLVRHPRRAWRRDELLDAVWGGRSSGARTVDVHVRRIRVKVGDLVTTVPCVGYRLADGASVAIMKK